VGRKQIIKNSSIYLISNMIGSAIPFLLFPLMTRYLTTEEYGLISMYRFLAAVAITMIGLNMKESYAREYINDEVNTKQYLGNCLMIITAALILPIVVSLVFGNQIESFSQYPKDYLWLVIAYSFSKILTDYLLVTFQFEKKAKLYGAIIIVRSFLNASISVVLVVGMKYGYLGRIVGQLIAFMVLAIVAIWVFAKGKYVELKYNNTYVKKALTFGVPLIPHSLSGIAVGLIDQVFITNMVSIAVTGVYSAAYQISTVIRMFVLSLNTAVQPFLYKTLEEGSHQSKLKIVKLSYLYFIALIVIALGFTFVAEYALFFLVPEAYIGAREYVFWIALGFSFEGMYLIFANLIYFSRKTGYLSVITFMVAALNIVLNLYMIPQYGGIGAAMATTITFIFKFFVAWIISSRVYKMPWLLGKES